MMSLARASPSQGEALSDMKSTPSRWRHRMGRLFSRSKSTTRSPAPPQPESVSESRLPSTTLDRDTNVQASATYNPAAEEGRVGVKPEPEPLVVEVRDVVDPKISRLPESAYQAALSTLKEEQRKQLESVDTIGKLFQQLQDEDSKNKEQSLLRKGLRVLKPYLEGLDVTIELISPFVNTNPPVGTALGIVKGVSSIIVSICGRFEYASNEIVGFLKRIPAIDRCADVVGSGESLPEIHAALVEVYTDILQFYLKTAALFEKSRFVLGVALDALKHEVPDIVSAFNTHASHLSSLLEAETFASAQEIKVELIESLIHEHLEHGLEYEWSYRNQLGRRADEACRWVTSHESFSHWMLTSHDSDLLALFGDMGCGKTMTTAFVADTLAQRGRRPLCAYYCKDEHESANLGNIYRSILLQFLAQNPNLKLRFWKWYKQEEAHIGGSPTHRDDKLRAILSDVILSSKEPVFIILDALDECTSQPRKELCSLFRELFMARARLKVFISSRYDENVEADLPPGVTRIELRSSPERDRAIAEYLVADISLDASLLPKVVDELVLRAAGSAIWLRIAVKYIERNRVKNHKGLEVALDRLPSSNGLAELYETLFKKVCGGVRENEMKLCRALEILAVARRPLTSEELSYAVFTINPVPDDPEATNMPELTELANSTQLFDLVRPFISAANDAEGKHQRLRLIHQSLKELILKAPPSEWHSNEAMAGRKKAGRAEELNAMLLQICIRYLLFDECDANSLFPNADRDAPSAELLAIGGVFDEEGSADGMTTPTSPTGGRGALLGPDFDPAELGFGGFYAYAAANWTGHFTDVAPERRPAAEQLLALCRKGSRRLENWVEQWRRPRCSYIPQGDFPHPTAGLDPLTVAALFGPVASVTDLLALNLDGSLLVSEESTWTAAQQLMGRLAKRGDVATIKELISNKALQPVFCSYKLLYSAVRDWRWSEAQAADATTTAGWEEIFTLLIHHLRTDLLSCGNDILCGASRRGCLPPLRPLLDAAETDPALQTAILTPPPDYIAARRQGRHQSIGEAVLGGRADVVSFLCARPWLAACHLRHVNGEGSTVFHLAAARGGDSSGAVLRTLLRHWPGGVDVRDAQGESPLALLVFDRTASREAEVIALVRLLLQEGGADATGRGDREGCSPLCNAVRAGHAALLRVLVVEGGADAWQAVRVDEISGRPCLVKGVDTWSDERVRERALKVLCSLLPLAVSVEYLM